MRRVLSISQKWGFPRQVTPLGACASRMFCAPTRPFLAPSDVEADLAKDIKGIIDNDRLVVFLTGTPENPRCRFTVQLVDLLVQLGVKYSFFNILDDDEVCEGLKTYSDWPTYPQIYIDGELLGGYDIARKMMLDGTFTKMLKEKNYSNSILGLFD
ncbi:glutaredoxin-like protein [Angomonas deanei]|uniref:Glutaredoxin, putative n=1 Tax=Angomonas deanei TaxID=59799 RepID=A0A7G2CRV8_9TRYP|nr:glutaredoxin-like protein [Angomonas deanei]CAD2222490.1 Glutaredoxin, putative [Angomonas deanei]|eukprot:EPY37744.1 glutaredoxin-like protein [Angomonas deanei]